MNVDSRGDSKYIILSAFKSTESRTKNEQNHNELLSLLYADKIRYKELSGSYHGEFELSVIVNYNHKKRLKELAARYKQDEVLLLHETGAHGVRKAELWDLINNKIAKAGWMRSVEKEVALKQPCYTYDNTQNQYFIIYKTYVGTVDESN